MEAEELDPHLPLFSLQALGYVKQTLLLTFRAGKRGW